MTPIVPPRLRSLCRLAAGAFALSILVLTAEARPVKSITGRTLDRKDIGRTLPMARLGDDVYAEVNSEWLKVFYRRYRSQLSRMGVVKWSERYDCRRFAGLFTELAQNQFFNEAFHSDTPAGTLALGPVWYRPGGSEIGHALVVAMTERGAIYLDPQSGREVNLTANERASIFFAVL